MRTSIYVLGVGVKIVIHNGKNNMAHLLDPLQIERPIKVKRKLKLPSLSGRYGFAIFTRTKEFFIGIQVAEVEIERVVRKKVTTNPRKGSVRVWQTDEL